MTVLGVWALGGPDAARVAETEVGSLVAADAVALLDGAVVSWESNRTSPRWHGIQNVPLVGALGSGFWGLLFGTVFYLPRLESLSDDATVGTGVLTGVGIAAEAIGIMRAMIRPGKSALVILLANEQGAAVVGGALSLRKGEQACFTLSAGQEANLRGVFGAGRRRSQPGVA